MFNKCNRKMSEILDNEQTATVAAAQRHNSISNRTTSRKKNKHTHNINDQTTLTTVQFAQFAKLISISLHFWSEREKSVYCLQKRAIKSCLCINRNWLNYLKYCSEQSVVQLAMKIVWFPFIWIFFLLCSLFCVGDNYILLL